MNRNLLLQIQCLASQILSTSPLSRMCSQTQYSHPFIVEKGGQHSVYTSPPSNRPNTRVHATILVAFHLLNSEEKLTENQHEQGG